MSNKNIFQWLSERPNPNLGALVRINDDEIIFGNDNWSHLSELEVKQGESAVIFLFRETDNGLVQSGLIHFSNKWEPLHPAILEQSNGLKKKITFADVLQEFPDCPATKTAPAEQNEADSDSDIIKAILDFEWPESITSSTHQKEEEPSTLDAMLEWLAALPPNNLSASIYLGDSNMVFSKANWKDMTGFGRAAKDRTNGEVIVAKADADGKLSIAGLLFTGRWFVLAPSSIEKDHGLKYPKNSKYLSFDELFPSCPKCVFAEA